MAGTRRLRVLRVYHSAVVTPWRQREQELRRLGFDVATVAPVRWNEGGSDVRLELQDGERVHRVRTFGRHPFRFAYEPVALWRALRRERPDVLDIHEEPASLVAFETLALARAAGVRAPFCLYSAENLPKRYPLPFRWTERLLLRRAAAVHSCNAAVEERLRAKGFSGPVTNLGLGVDAELFASRAALHQGAGSGGGTGDPADLRLGEPSVGGGPGVEPQCEPDVAPPGGLSVGYVGRLDRRKGIFVLLHAVAAVEGARVTFVGAGGSATELAGEIDRLGMASRARIAAFAAPAELPALFNRFDVVAVPSLDTPRWSEQFGRVAVEAMAAGVPVVVSDSGALAEVVCGAGALVPQGDVSALAEALRRLSGDAAERQRMVRSGHERAKHYSWAAVASRQAALYRRMSASTLASMDGASPVEVAMESGVRPPARDAEVTE